MSAGDLWLLVTVASLVLLAGAFSAADAALGSFSQARAGELAAEERAGSKRLLHLLEDAPRYLNTALLLRLACEVTAIVLATLLVRERFQESWAVTVMVTVAVMLVLSFVVIGVAPRTLGRQHSESVALFSAGPLTWVTRVLGPVPRVLILLGNAITPGKGFTDGPFSTETELRELVDLAEASSLIESEERRMIHSVFDLSDTTAREVMVPRGDVVFVERHKNLRQTLSLFLRSGFSRVPVIEDNLDHVVGAGEREELGVDGDPSGLLAGQLQHVLDPSHASGNAGADSEVVQITPWGVSSNADRWRTHEHHRPDRRHLRADRARPRDRPGGLLGLLVRAVPCLRTRLRRRVDHSP